MNEAKNMYFTYLLFYDGNMVISFTILGDLRVYKKPVYYLCPRCSDVLYSTRKISSEVQEKDGKYRNTETARNGKNRIARNRKKGIEYCA